MDKKKAEIGKSDWMSIFGANRTGVIVNITRLILLLFSAIWLTMAVITSARLAFYESQTINLFHVYLAIGFFVSSVVLLALVALFKIESQPFLLSNIIYEQMEKNVALRDVESFLKTYKAQLGVAGFFNRLGFSGLSLGTIAAAFALLLIGMFAVRLNIVTPDQYPIFSDLAKLLFGAFIGSFAAQRRAVTEPGEETPAHKSAKK
jgi:hypothetical protein